MHLQATCSCRGCTVLTSGTDAWPPLVKVDIRLSVVAAVVLRRLPSGFVCSGWPAIRMPSGGCAAGEAAEGSRAQEGGGEPLLHPELQFSKAAEKKKKRHPVIRHLRDILSLLFHACLLLYSFSLGLLCSVVWKRKDDTSCTSRTFFAFFLYIRLYCFREI